MRCAVVMMTILATGCSGPAATCQQAADRMLSLAADQAKGHGHTTIGTSLARVVVERCDVERWSADARSCVASVTSVDELNKCRDDLGESAAPLIERFTAELEQLDKEERARTSGIVVNLPKTASAEIDVTKASLVIDITADGVFVQGSRVDDAQLGNVFRAAFARDKQTQVIIRAAQGVQHGRVVGVMEGAKVAGLSRLAIATSPEP